jgi:hypothetical protein
MSEPTRQSIGDFVGKGVHARCDARIAELEQALRAVAFDGWACRECGSYGANSVPVEDVMPHKPDCIVGKALRAEPSDRDHNCCNTDPVCGGHG